MNHLDPNAPWMPGHVCMGTEISVHSSREPHELLLQELKDAGVNQLTMRVRLINSAQIATKAIAKMLVSTA